VTDDLETHSRSHPRPGRRPGRPLDLESRYREYLAVLNERRLDDLAHHVHDELTYNGEPMTRQQYQDLIAADVAAAPDLVYDAEIVVAAADQVACRLVFDCRPRGELLGFRPEGARLRFAEHVFYRYRDARITAVRSMIDRAAIAEQLAAAAQGFGPETDGGGFLGRTAG
jgi:predicted ester cyclase